MNAAVVESGFVDPRQLSNTKASHNGKVMENFVTSLFPDINIFNDTLDAEYHGIQVEIKSCQVHVTDHSTSNSQRSGRFCFEGVQHKALIEAGGEYFFIVHDAGVPTAFFRVAAALVGLPEFSGVKSVSWRSITKKVI